MKTIKLNSEDNAVIDCRSCGVLYRGVGFDIISYIMLISLRCLIMIMSVTALNTNRMLLVSVAHVK